MTNQNGRAFNEWLRAQLKAKKMSQRQLAQQSGVDHSTISRLIRGDRMPSLGTATKLARGLRELRDDADTPAYLGLVSTTTTNPTARVEYALRADELLSEPQVRQVMEYYLAVRMRRFGRAFQPDRQERPGDVGLGTNGPRSLTNGLQGAHEASNGHPNGQPNGTAPVPNGPRPAAVRPAPLSSIGMAGRYTALRPLPRPSADGSRRDSGGI
jgi:transcriptional regulator with XRE-family HTH domain